MNGRGVVSGRTMVLVLALTAAGALVLAGCSGPATDGVATPLASAAASPSGTATVGPTATASASASASPSVAPAETPERKTKTLPEPPKPTKPAATTAGPLGAASLPSPPGWKKVSRSGSEEGFKGNGTWVHAKDPRYAALELMSVGCDVVAEDAYTDPQHALAGDYENDGGQPGNGLVLQFATEDQAARYFAAYKAQVDACNAPDSPVAIKVVESSAGLIDHRTYPDGSAWTEIATVRGNRATFIILTDPTYTLDQARAEQLMKQM